MAEAPEDLETAIRRLLRSYKGVSAVVAISYKTPGGKRGEYSYVVQTTGDEKCWKLASMLLEASRPEDAPEPETEEGDDD